MKPYQLSDQRALVQNRIDRLRGQITEADQAEQPSGDLAIAFLQFYRLMLSSQLDLANSEAQFLDARTDAYRRGIAQA